MSHIEIKYYKKLGDLKYNSKAVINMLSTLAGDNIKHGQIIVGVIKEHITKIPAEEKLPALYLIDSIVKNVGGEYRTLFSSAIVNIFCGVFKEVNENVRRKMFSLRQTWNDIFPNVQLYILDVKTNVMDPKWPITAKITSAIQGNQQQLDLLKSKKRKLDLEIAGIVQQLIPSMPTTSVESSVSVKPALIESIKQSSERLKLVEPAFKKWKAEKVDKSIRKENVDFKTQFSQRITHSSFVSQTILSTSNEISNWANLKANPSKSIQLNLDSSRSVIAESNPDFLNKSNQRTDIDLKLWNMENSLKPRQQTNIDALYSGKPCSNCSVRFAPEQTIKYSQHLDWHFRENRSNRDSALRANSRRWYYNVADWVQYDESVGEREKSWFEIQQSQMDMANKELAQRSDIPNCIAGPDDVGKVCDMCHDQFETFFNDDDEEWHLRNALRVDKKTFHPICFEDYNKSSSILDKSEVKCKIEDDDDIKLSMEAEQGVAVDLCVPMSPSTSQSQQATASMMTGLDDNFLWQPAPTTTTNKIKKNLLRNVNENKIKSS